MADATRVLGENPLVSTIADHIGYFTRLFPIKAAVASAIALLFDVWGWERIVFSWYCAFALLDLALANVQAFVFGVWTPRFVRLWMSKLFFELFIIVLVSGIFHSLFAITGQLITFANWMFILCILTYFASILDRLHVMGAPIPVFLTPVLRAVRRRVSMHLSVLLEDEDISKELERALANKHGAELEKDDTAIPPTEAEAASEPPPADKRRKSAGDDEASRAA